MQCDECRALRCSGPSSRVRRLLCPPVALNLLCLLPCSDANSSICVLVSTSTLSPGSKPCRILPQCPLIQSSCPRPPPSAWTAAGKQNDPPQSNGRPVLRCKHEASIRLRLRISFVLRLRPGLRKGIFFSWLQANGKLFHWLWLPWRWPHREQVIIFLSPPGAECRR